LLPKIIEKSLIKLGPEVGPPSVTTATTTTTVAIDLILKKIENATEWLSYFADSRCFSRMLNLLKSAFSNGCITQTWSISKDQNHLLSMVIKFETS
jgi:hypothetical protein